MEKLMNLPQITQLVKYQTWGTNSGYIKPKQSLQSQVLLYIFSGNEGGLGERTESWRNLYLSFRVLLVTLRLFLGFR